MRKLAIAVGAFVILGLFAVALGHAQTASGPAVALGPAQPVPTIGTTASALTELEKVKIENLTLKSTIIGLQKSLLQTQNALLDKSGEQVKVEESRLITDIQKAHPGFTVGSDGGLIALPAEKK